MSTEVIMALVGILTLLGGAVATVIKRVDIMEWWAGVQRRSAMKATREDDAFGWTRSQLERERIQREEDARSNRLTLEALREKMEERIAHLEGSLAKKDEALHASELREAKSQALVERLRKERDALAVELANTKDMYTTIIADAFARRVADEEG